MHEKRTRSARSAGLLLAPLFALGVLLFAQPAFAGASAERVAQRASTDVCTTTWLGGTGSWFTPENWSAGVVPSSSAAGADSSLGSWRAVRKPGLPGKACRLRDALLDEPQGQLLG